MKSVSISKRNETIYVLPKIGLVDGEPVFTASINEREVAAALADAIAAVPVNGAAPTLSKEYRSPLLDAMKVKSAAAYERGLKSAVLRLGDDRYEFYRYVPHPMFKIGFRREDEPAFTVSIDTPFSVLAGNIIAAFQDPTWPMKKSQLPRSR